MIAKNEDEMSEVSEGSPVSVAHDKKKDEIKEEGRSKEAAKMLNRAIDYSDVTKAGPPDQSLSFSYRPNRPGDDLGNYYIVRF